MTATATLSTPGVLGCCANAGEAITHLVEGWDVGVGVFPNKALRKLRANIVAAAEEIALSGHDTEKVNEHLAEVADMFAGHCDMWAINFRKDAAHWRGDKGEPLA